MQPPGDNVLGRRHLTNQRPPGRGLNRLLSGVNTKKDYGGKYDDVPEGHWLVLMRQGLEGKFTNNEEIMAIEDVFADEFPQSAIRVLLNDIEDDTREPE